MNYTRNDFYILKVMYENKSISELKSITIKEIMEMTNLSYKKIRITLNSFLKEEFVCYGIKKVNAKTFYITEEGKNKLREVAGGKVNG